MALSATIFITLNSTKNRTNIASYSLNWSVFFNNFYNFAPWSVLLNGKIMDVKFFKGVLSDSYAGDSGCYFRDETTTDEAQLVVVSAPWSVTADFGKGSAYAPDAIIDASARGGVYDAISHLSLEGKIATAEIDYNIQELSGQLGREAERVASHIEDNGELVGDKMLARVARINSGFEEMQSSIYAQVLRHAKAGKRIAVIGGDHSVAFGAVKALAEQHEDMGILAIDAHADLRQSTSPYRYSHDSIMRNVVEEIPAISKVVEVGVRDVVSEEMEFASANPKVEIFFAEELAARMFEGSCWQALCDEICSKLPQKVYISLDIDALKIEFCHNTNFPVPGGLNFNEVVYLIDRVVATGHQIVGFDITEVVPNIDNTMDSTVATRLLSKMAITTLK